MSYIFDCINESAQGSHLSAVSTLSLVNICPIHSIKMDIVFFYMLYTLINEFEFNILPDIFKLF